MQIAIFVLLVILIAAVVYFGLQASANKSEVVLPTPLDTDAIARTVQTAINLEAISTSVQGAVAAQMLKEASIGHQIVYFTCKKEILNLAKDMEIPVKIIT